MSKRHVYTALQAETRRALHQLDTGSETVTLSCGIEGLDRMVQPGGLNILVTKAGRRGLRTFIELKAKLGGREFTSVGAAERYYLDLEDPVLGVEVAMARALVGLVERLATDIDKRTEAANATREGMIQVEVQNALGNLDNLVDHAAMNARTRVQVLNDQLLRRCTEHAEGYDPISEL